MDRYVTTSCDFICLNHETGGFSLDYSDDELERKRDLVDHLILRDQLFVSIVVLGVRFQHEHR